MIEEILLRIKSRYGESIIPGLMRNYENSSYNGQKQIEKFLLKMLK